MKLAEGVQREGKTLKCGAHEKNQRTQEPPRSFAAPSTPIPIVNSQKLCAATFMSDEDCSINKDAPYRHQALSKRCHMQT